ncbi:MAG TPA: phosphatase PAP2 family protein [Gammaproteobacteria bacterium]
MTGGVRGAAGQAGGSSRSRVPPGGRCSARRGKRRCAACAALVLASWCSAAGAGDTAEEAGDVLRVAIPAAALAVTIRRDDRDGRRQLYRAFAANVAATWLLKETVEDERPDGSDDDAFPSGHTSVAFQGAAFLHRRYGIRTAWPAYALAAFTGWSRIDADEHDEADVLAGAALGIGASFLLVDKLERKRIAVIPAAGDGAWGVRITGSF